MNEVSKKPRGRPLGSKSADSIEYQAFLVKVKFMIPEEEIWVLHEAKEMYEFYKDRIMSGRFSPMEDMASKYLSIYQNILREMASRVYPKLKAIEHHQSGILDGMTGEQKLEALKQAVAKQELEIKKNGPGSV